MVDIIKKDINNQIKTPITSNWFGFNNVNPSTVKNNLTTPIITPNNSFQKNATNTGIANNLTFNDSNIDKNKALNVNTDANTNSNPNTGTSSPYTSSSSDEATKNNNPGNLKDPVTGKFRQFSTPQEGVNAQIHQLDLYKTGQSKTGINGNSTLAQMIGVYAPSSDGNNPNAYAENVAKQLGININTPLSQIDTTQLAKAMTSIESPAMYKTLYGQSDSTGANTGTNMGNTDTGVTTGATQTSTEPAGTTIKNTDGSIGVVQNDGTVINYASDSPQAQLNNLDTYHQQITQQIADIQSGNFKLDPISQDQINTLQTTLGTTLNSINQSIYSSKNATEELAARTGAAMTGPAEMIGTLQNITQNGINEINTLNNTINSKITAIKYAAQQGQISTLQENFKDYQDAVLKRIDTVEKLNNDVFDHQQKIQDYNIKKETLQQKIADDKIKNSIAYSRLAIAQQQAASGIDATQLTPDAVNLLATNYAITGNLPSFGMGKQGATLKTAILNKAATLGNSQDIINAQQTFKTNSQALTKLTTSSTKLDSINTTIKNTLPTLATLADKVNMPLLPNFAEKAYIEAQASAGNSDASNYLLALNTIQAQLSGADAAEVGSTTGGQMYIQRAQDALSGGMTGEQYRDLVKTFDDIASQSHKSMQDEITKIKSQQGAFMYSTDGTPNTDPLGIGNDTYVDNNSTTDTSDPLGIMN